MSDLAVPVFDQLFLARQPILDAQETLIGYELLFRDSSLNAATPAEPGLATADVVCKAFAELGLVNALEGYKAFIIADEEFLMHDAIEALPPGAVIFEIDAALASRVAVQTRCRALADDGFSFCLNNLTELTPAIAPLLRQSMFLKLNIHRLSDALPRQLTRLPADIRPIPIASHIETQADRQRALQLGFAYFQGYYFAHPILVEGKKVDPAIQTLLRILQLIQQDADVAEIEAVFKGEAALTLKLLRLTNSVGVGLRVRIASVRQAINVIGRRQIQRWLQLLLFSHHVNDNPARNPLLQLAAFKGYFMEQLARRCYPLKPELPEAAFLTGLMSLMPALLGQAMDRITEQIVVAPPIRQALLLHEGDLGLLLDLTQCFDDDDLPGVYRILARLGQGVGMDLLNRSLSDAMAWAQSLAVESGETR